MTRVGLVSTRIPTISAFFYFFALLVPSFFLRKNRYFLTIFSALSILLFSNVLTNKELETANHVGRFVIMFGSLSIVYLVSKSRKFLVLAALWLLLFRSNFSTITPSIYIPKYENRYVIFNPYGGLHLVSTDEVLERYLVSKAPQKLTVPILVNDFRSYAGTGPAIHQVAQHNYRMRICNLFRLGNCGEIKDVLSFYGEAYFQKILNRYETDVVPNISLYYQKYHKEILDELPR